MILRLIVLRSILVIIMRYKTIDVIIFWVFGKEQAGSVLKVAISVIRR